MDPILLRLDNAATALNPTMRGLEGHLTIITRFISRMHQAQQTGQPFPAAAQIAALLNADIPDIFPQSQRLASTISRFHEEGMAYQHIIQTVRPWVYAQETQAAERHDTPPRLTAIPDEVWQDALNQPGSIPPSIYDAPSDLDAPANRQDWLEQRVSSAFLMLGVSIPSFLERAEQIEISSSNLLDAMARAFPPEGLAD